MTKLRRLWSQISTKRAAKYELRFEEPPSRGLSLPEPLLFYIAKNCSNPELRLKLLLISKYFLLVYQPIIFENLTWNQKTRKWTVKVGFKTFEAALHELASPFWLSSTLTIAGKEDLIPWNYTHTSMLLQKLQLCRLRSLRLEVQEITFSAYKILTAGDRLQNLALEHVTVKDDDGYVVPIEMLLVEVLEVRKISITFPYQPYMLTKKSMKKLAKLPPMVNLEELQLRNIPKLLNPKLFTKFAKKNAHAKTMVIHHRTDFDKFRFSFGLAKLTSKKWVDKFFLRIVVH